MSNKLFIHFRYFQARSSGRMNGSAEPETSVSGFRFKFSFNFELVNFEKLGTEFGKWLESPIFTEGYYKTKWSLRVYPKGDQDAGDISVFLINKSKEGKVIDAKYKIYIIDHEDNKLLMRTDSTVFHEFNCGKGWTSFIDRARLLSNAQTYLHEGSLVFGCDVQIKAVKSSSEDSIIPNIQMSEDFGDLLESKRFSDMIIKVDSQELHAHKNILVARSSVFSAMFSHDLKEAVEGRIEISDVEVEPFKEMLKFMYTGKAPSLKRPDWCSVWGEALLAVAEKYDLQRLKAMCEVELASSIRVENAAHLLLVAESHSAKYLKKNASSFMNDHISEVVNTEGWKELVAKCPNVIIEAYKTLG